MMIWHAQPGSQMINISYSIQFQLDKKEYLLLIQILNK